jgi:predicted dehydrogenase
LACHLIDALVTILGKPNEIHGLHLKTQDDAFKDNQLATFRFEHALATIGSNHNDPFGGPRRQFTVVGTEGTITIQPLEPPKLSLSLTKDRGEFKRGTQDVPMPKTEGRYHDEFRDMAKSSERRETARMEFRSRPCRSGSTPARVRSSTGWLAQGKLPESYCFPYLSKV